MQQHVSTRPSFFEVYAAQHLSAALRPAVRFVLEVLSVRHPRLIRIANRSDDVFTAVLLLLEASHLSRHSALLAESFYALRRSSDHNFRFGAPDKPISLSTTLVTLLLSVILPHVRVKLDEWFSDATGGAAASLFPEGFDFARQTEDVAQQTGTPPSTSPSTAQERLSRMPCPWLLKWVLRYPRILRRLVKAIRSYIRTPEFRARALKWYPRICAVVDTSNLLLNVLYLYGHSRFFSISLALQGLVLRRTTPNDLLQMSAMRRQQYASGEWGLTRFLVNSTDRVLALLKMSFFASIFAFRFLQYFYAAEASAPRESGPVMPPPDVFEPASNVDRESALASGRCPLCKRDRVNPTACVSFSPSPLGFDVLLQHPDFPDHSVPVFLKPMKATSGYVFCYMCIVNHIQHSQKCPVTLAPTTMEDLVRVFDHNSGG